MPFFEEVISLKGPGTPAISPDGKKIAFTIQEQEEEKEKEREIFQIRSHLLEKQGRGRLLYKYIHPDQWPEMF